MRLRSIQVAIDLVTVLQFNLILSIEKASHVENPSGPIIGFGHPICVHLVDRPVLTIALKMYT